MNKVFYVAEDIANDLAISTTEAAVILKELSRKMENEGGLVVSGKISKQYYEEQKAKGFCFEGQDPTAAKVFREDLALCQMKKL